MKTKDVNRLMAEVLKAADTPYRKGYLDCLHDVKEVLRIREYDQWDYSPNLTPMFASTVKQWLEENKRQDKQRKGQANG